MKYIINDSKPLFILTNTLDSNNLKSIISDTKNTHLIDLSDILSSNIKSNQIKKIDNIITDNNACVLYTSGSTGLPKGVMLSNSTIMNRICWQWDEFCLNEYDIGAFKTSLNFVDHIAEIFSFILKGLPLCVIDPIFLSSSLNKLIDLLYDQKITYLVVVPSLLKNILLYSKVNNSYFKLNHIKRWVVSGESLSIDLLNLFFDMIDAEPDNCSILSNFYGSTEVTADITFVTFKKREQMNHLLLNGSNVPIGFPISNSRIYLMDENMNLIKAENTIGEIYAAGSCLANGYLNDFESSSNKFTILTNTNERVFKTGDFGLINNSVLYYSGRSDLQIKISGKRIDLNELEYHSMKLNIIQSFVPLIYEHSSSEKHIIVFYKSNSNDKSTEQINKMIIDHLKSCVFSYMIPNVNNLIRIDTLPLLYNGKIDKMGLKKLYKEKQIKKVNSSNCSKTTLKDQILEITQNVTGIYLDPEEIDLNLKFNELGINSLNSVEIFLGK
jgi:non-ribosomal peptide synthetase component F